MQNDGQLERIRLVEPQPGMPAQALPGLDQLLAHTKRGKYVFSGAVFAILAVIGVVALPDVGPGVAAMLIVGPGLLAYTSVRMLVVTSGMAGLAASSFTAVTVAPDGMRVTGTRVSLRLPDERWLVFRTTEPNRLLIAGLRRVWLLGPDARGRVCVLVPSGIRLHRARLSDAPASGSTLVEPAVREPLRPGDDPVLASTLRTAGRRLLITAGVFALIAATALWAGIDSAVRTHFRSTGLITAGFVLAFAMLFLAGQVLLVWSKQRNFLPANAGWFELRVSLAAPFVTNASGVSVLTGYATLPDNSVHTFRTARIDAALAANIAMTGQLWAIGPFQRGKPIPIGLPGYPLIGQVNLDVGNA